MFDIRAGFIVLILLASGCNPRLTRYVTLDDVDPAMGARYGLDPSLNAFYDHDGRHGPEREAYRLVWVDLCALKPCQPEARQFSEVFREIASRAGALQEVEFLAEVARKDHVSAEDAEQLLRFSVRTLAETERRVGRLSVLLAAIDVAVLVPAHRPYAKEGILRARAQFNDIRQRIPAVRALLEPPDDDSVELAPEVHERAEVLRERMLPIDDYAPSGELEHDEVLALAVDRGLDALDADLLAREQAAAAAPVVVFEAVQGVADVLAQWFALGRSEVEACLADLEAGEVTMVGAYGEIGDLSRFEALDGEMPDHVTQCLIASLAAHPMPLTEPSAGTFNVRLAKLAPAITVAEDDVDPPAEAELDVWRASYDLDVWAVTPASTDVPQHDGRAERWAVGGLFVGGASLLASGVLGAFAIDLSASVDNEANEGLSRSQRSARAERTRRVRNWALVAGVGGILLTGASVTVLMTHHRRSTRLGLQGNRLTLTQVW